MHKGGGGVPKSRKARCIRPAAGTRKDDEEQQKNNLISLPRPPAGHALRRPHIAISLVLPAVAHYTTGSPCSRKERCSVVGGRRLSAPLPGPG
jgi:hypothetical protein